MKQIGTFKLSILLAAILSLFSGCATLPNVTQIIKEIPARHKPYRIASANGLLTPQKSNEIIDQLKSSVDPTDILERHTAVVESVTETPLTKGNKVILLIDGEETYGAMFKAIESAKDSINIETYIMDDDEIGRKFAGLLLKKQADGVTVNLIFDSIGSLNTSEAFFERMRQGGIHVVEFNPINPLKARGRWKIAQPDHRKILVVDGRLAIAGGINISKVYKKRRFRRRKLRGAPLPWRDTDVQIEGPAVAEFQKMFLETWQKQGGELDAGKDYYPALMEEGNSLVRVVGSTPGPGNRLTFIVYVSAITFAQRSIHLTNAYFIPDSQIMDALTTAARRGVDVKIILPAHSDSSVGIYATRYNYERLLKAGVRLYERKNMLLHAKTAVIDGVWSTVGSTNLDYWSLSSDDEVNAVVLDPAFAIEMEKMFDRDLAESEEITWNKWKERPVFPRVGEFVAHLFEYWM